MAYNPYQWWKGNKKRKLPQSAHLFDKITNGDFNYSHYFTEAEASRQEYASLFQETMKRTGDYGQARATAKMKNVRALKLDEEGHAHEIRLLTNLRNELREEFGFDLWDEMMKAEPMDLEELYDFYCHEKMCRRGLDI
jgi:hypothetical protein